jgi:hypothetical protein
MIDLTKIKRHLFTMPEPIPEREWSGPLRDWAMVYLFQDYVKQRKLLNYNRFFNEKEWPRMKEIKLRRIADFETNWPLFRETYEEHYEKRS